MSNGRAHLAEAAKFVEQIPDALMPLDGSHPPFHGRQVHELHDVESPAFSAQEYDHLLERTAEYLDQARQALDALRSRLGLPPSGPPRIVRGQVQDTTEQVSAPLDLLPENAGDQGEAPDGSPVEFDELSLDSDQAAQRFGYRVSPYHARHVTPALYEHLSEQVRFARQHRQFERRLGTTIIIAASGLLLLHVTLYVIGVAPGAGRSILISLFVFIFGSLTGLGIAIDDSKYITRMRSILRSDSWQVWPFMVTVEEHRSPDAELVEEVLIVILMAPGGRPVITLRQVDTTVGGSMILHSFPSGPLVLWIGGRLNAHCVVAAPFPVTPRQAFLCRPC